MPIQIRADTGCQQPERVECQRNPEEQEDKTHPGITDPSADPDQRMPLAFLQPPEDERQQHHQYQLGIDGEASDRRQTQSGIYFGEGVHLCIPP